jgi:hypothetical protein
MSMEIVSLAQVRLERPGSTRSSGFTGHTPIEQTCEIADDRLETLKALVARLAEPHGDSAASLRDLRLESAQRYRSAKGAIVLNIQGPSTHYSSPYAICLVFSALKAGDRYFRLEEVAGVTS